MRRTQGAGGDAALDLTCGLGVDALALGLPLPARRGARTRSRAGRPSRPAIWRLLGAANVEVVCASAEEYLAATTERSTGWRPTPTAAAGQGCKLVRLEECSPDILRLLPAVRRVGARLA